MHLSLWKPLSHCAAVLLAKNSRRRGGGGGDARGGRGGGGGTGRCDDPSSFLRQLRDALDAASEEGSLCPPPLDGAGADADAAVARSRSLARLRAQRDFLRATALAAAAGPFRSLSDLPLLPHAVATFLAMYPDYASTSDVDRLRVDHYSHLDAPGAGKVCLDYCGFGLFDSGWDSSSASFTLHEVNANLSNHALYGGAARGTVENDIKERILEYLNVPASEYALVFTVSRGSAFRLLAECYPFESNRRLLTMFDHESQSVNWMAQSARAKGAKTRNAWFRWPTLKLCSMELRKEIVGKRKGRRRDAAVGLFVFPVQSRVTGAKYSYQWMALAQQNGWHVMLDAGALGPKDMDSLGLSLFRPDFIISSFYRVFGADPTGFGCLLVKKSVMGSLQGRNGCNVSGMVKIVPVFPQYLSDSIDGFNDLDGLEDDSSVHKDEKSASNGQNGSQLPAFSGVYTSAQVRETFETDPGRDSSSDRDGASTIFEQTESISMDEVMRSPAFSEDCSSENSFWVDVGQSPLGSEKSDQFKKGKLGSPLPSSWFNGRKSNKRMSPNLSSRISRSPLYDGNVISFDAAVLSVSQDTDCLKEDPEEEIFDTGRRNHLRQVSEIQEEPEVEEVACQHGVNGVVDQKESAIRRETEGEFRLLGGRDGNSRFTGDRLFGLDEIDGALSMGRRVSFNTEAHVIADGLNRTADAAEVSEYTFRDDYDDCASDGYDDAQDWGRREPEIICRHIDHVDFMGLNRTTLRLRYLINWLVTSMLQLKLPNSNGGDDISLVHIYGPKIKYERGAAVAFNVKQSDGKYVNAEVFQKIAEKNGIYVGIGFLTHIKIDMSQKMLNGAQDVREASFYKNGRRDSKKETVRVEVVTASLGFLTNFEDVYKMWAFVAKFLDPSFLESERLAIAADHSEGQA